MRRRLATYCVTVAAFSVVFAILHFWMSRHSKENSSTSPPPAREERAIDVGQKTAEGGRDTADVKNLEVQVDKYVEDLNGSDAVARPWMRKIEDCTRLIDVKIEEMPEPKEYASTLTLTPGEKHRYVSVTNMAFASSESPFMQMPCETEIATRLDDKGDMLVDVRQERPFVLGNDKMDLPSNYRKEEICEFLFRDGSLYGMRPDGSGPEEKSVSPAGGDVQRWFFSFPKDIDFRVGCSWTEERGGVAPGKTTCKFAGFAKVGGIGTAKIVSEDLATLDASAADATAEVVVKSTMAKFRSLGGRGTEGFEEKVRSFLKRGLRQRAVTYVDIKTGLVVRRETTIVTGEGSEQSVTTGEISQYVPTTK